MEATLVKTLIFNGNMMEIVRNLLASGWRKRRKSVFYKERNNYTIEIDGSNSPMWSVAIEQKNEEFDEEDWKLRQDLKSLSYLGQKKNHFKKLYVNDANKSEIKNLIEAMRQSEYNLIFNNDYVLFRMKQDKVRIMKLAASMDLVEQPDGWYVGQKKIL